MRPSLERYMLNIAKVVATRSTCSRRAVGAVITNASNHIISTGHNGVPSGVTHCVDVPCKGADFESGQGLDLCKAQHAEVNAAAHCRDLPSAFAIYLTTSPCMSCAKLIAATHIKKVVFEGDSYDASSLDYLEDLGIEIFQLPMEELKI